MRATKEAINERERSQLAAWSITCGAEELGRDDATDPITVLRDSHWLITSPSHSQTYI
jgi:hypothetical protein